MARPTKFDEELCNEICDFHRKGLPQIRCADILGIDRTTLHRWLKKGEKAKSGKYRKFYINWLRAEADYLLLHTEKINDSTSWLAHQYLLQVTDPDTYVVAEKQQIEAETKTQLTADVDMNDPRIHEKDLEILQNLIRDKNGN